MKGGLEPQPLQALVAQLSYDIPAPPSTDLTDALWERVRAGLLTAQREEVARASTTGALNAILRKLFTGRPWATLPGGHTSRRRLEQWLNNGTWQAIEDAMVNTPD